MDHEKIIVLDFGGQYNQLIARRVRECNVYCEVQPYTLPLEEIKAKNPKGIIFTGGPNSVYDETSPRYTNEIYEMGVPILGMGIGFTLALGIMGLIREFLGSGTAFDIPIYANTGVEPAGIFMLAPGGFFVFAILIAAINYFSKGKAIKKKEIGCEGCAMADSCGGACDGKEADA